MCQAAHFGKLDDAAQLLKESLKLDPSSSVAANELRYIEKIRNQSIKPRDATIVNPQTMN